MKKTGTHENTYIRNCELRIVNYGFVRRYYVDYHTDLLTNP
ncbi:hypothetical protein CLV51_103799 [Chitinophaga niastensis]|uniref:Uncharacterized protein n=1 Tax=Chitinophaga niastensis TaxID=536980 RepID=A0A2P8HKS6_CHINA|nr:hypothetical protein CLV51_103799 [Chitinophaga niastensis]